MRYQALNGMKALILILTAMYVANLLVGGTLFEVIAPRLIGMSGLAVILFILVAGAYELGTSKDVQKQANSDAGGQEIAGILLVALPLVVGIAVPTQPLGAIEAARRGVVTRYSGGNLARLGNSDPADRTVLDWAQAIAANSEPQDVYGQKANVSGFVYHDPRAAANQFMLTRFAMACCVTDAFAVGVVVQAYDASQLKSDNWVLVQGTFREGQFADDSLPILVASEILPIQQPEQVYLYP